MSQTEVGPIGGSGEEMQLLPGSVTSTWDDTEMGEETPVSVHVAAPFDLHFEKELPTNEEDKEFMRTIFPGSNTKFFFDGLFLQVVMERRPVPELKTFAGVPVVYSQIVDFGAPPRMLPLHITGSPSITLFPDMEYHSAYFTQKKSIDSKYMFRSLRSYFWAVQIPITEMIYWGVHVTVVLENNADTTNLPCRIGGLIILYLREAKMPRFTHEVPLPGPCQHMQRGPVAFPTIATLTTAKTSVIGHCVGLGTRKDQPEDGPYQYEQAPGWSAVDYMYFGEDLASISPLELFEAEVHVGDNTFSFPVKYIANPGKKGHWQGWCVCSSYRAC